MSGAHSGTTTLVGTVLLAAALWFITFALGGASFWIKISISAATLAALPPEEPPGTRSVFHGLRGLG